MKLRSEALTTATLELSQAIRKLPKLQIDVIWKRLDSGNVRRVVTQEGSPSLGGRPPSFDHVLGDARLRDLKPELEQPARLPTPAAAEAGPVPTHQCFGPDNCENLQD